MGFGEVVSFSIMKVSECVSLFNGFLRQKYRMSRTLPRIFLFFYLHLLKKLCRRRKHMVREREDRGLSA